MNQVPVKDAVDLAVENYKEYSLYVSQGRSYPQLADGMKTAYKRAIYGMYLNNNHKITKVAELAAHALPYHPHPTSVSGVIVQLGEAGNKLKLMETKGNWGDSTRKILASADRYIGGYLSPLAEMLFCDSVEYTKFVKGEIDKDEPEALPALLPLCFINGAKGIPSGLPTLNIPTIDIMGMVDYYIDILQHKNLSYIPRKLPKPNYTCSIVSDVKDWEQVLRSGKGSIKLAPVMSLEGNTITITELPQSKSVENVYKLIEKEILSDKVDFIDKSTSVTSIEITKLPYKQVDMNEMFKKLYTKLQVSESFNMAFFDSEHIYVPCGFNKVVKANLKNLIHTHSNRIEHELEDLKLKLKVLEIIEQVKKGNDIKTLVDLDTKGAVAFIAAKYDTSADVATKVFQKPLSYLTKEHLQEIEDLKHEISELETDKSDIYEFLIKKYKALKKELSKVVKTNGQ